MVELASTLSPNHRMVQAEYRRVGYLANGWNAVRRWNARTTSLQTAGIEGPSALAGDWEPHPPNQVGVSPVDYNRRRYRYRYMDSTTGYVSDPSAEAESWDAAAAGTWTTGTLYNPSGSCAFQNSNIFGNGGTDFSGQGFAIGGYVIVAGATDSANNGTWGPITGVAPHYIQIASKTFTERFSEASVTFTPTGYVERTLDFSIGAPTALLGPGTLAITASTITRSSGSFLDDGLGWGDYITLTNAEDSANNGTWGPITSVTALVITLLADVENPQEGASLTVNAADTTMTWQRAALGRIQPSSDSKVDTIILEATLTSKIPELISRHGPDTTGLAITAREITRNDGGSFLDDGILVGDLININGPEDSGNNRSFGPVTAVSASTIEFRYGQCTANAADTTAEWEVYRYADTGSGEAWFKIGEALNTAASVTAETTDDADLEQKFLSYPDYGHSPPPITKNILSYRDRLWFFGQVTHAVGNCDPTNNSVNVDVGGTSPDWNTEALGAAAGESSVEWLFQRDGDAEVYPISYYDSAGTQIVLKKAYAGTTGNDVGYKIFSRTNVIWVSEPAYPEGMDLSLFINGPNGEAAGDITAGVGFQGSILFFSGSTITRFSYGQDPHTDAAMVPLTNKAGALNQRVVIEHEGFVYTMDRRGWHRFDGVTATLISRPLGSILPSIDFDYAERFHACYLPDSRAIRWWVCYTGDTYPKNYVQLDLDTGAWSTGTYLQGITDSRLVRQGDGLRLFLLDENGHTWWGDTGLADGCPAANSHLTAAAGCTTTVMNVDETVPTTNVGIVGCYLSRRTTAGAFESRRISACTANTVTVASAFSETPADGDLFWVGPIPSKLKTRAFGYDKDLKAKTRTGHLTIAFKPTSSARYLQVRVYEDYSATAKTWSVARNGLPGLTKPGANTRYPTSDWLVDLSRSDGLVTIPIGAEWKRYFSVELQIDEPDADFELIAMEFDGQALAEAGGV